MTFYDEQSEPEAPGPRLSFDLKIESFNTSRFYDDVVNRAVEQMLGASWSPQKLAKDVQAAVQDKVLERLDAVLGDAVTTMLSKPIQQFDTFGEPVGKPISVEDIVRNGATGFLTEHVDRDGKPNRNSYGDKKTRLERLVEDSVNSSLQKEMKVEIDRVRAELINRAAEAAAAVLARIK